MDKQSISKRLNDWMRGRNGADELGNTVVALSIIVLIINLFAHTRVLAVGALAMAIYSCWRMSSKNVTARRKENREFLKAFAPAIRWIKNPKASINEQRSYKHLTCPTCGQQMRVPRGKGKMRVTCPNCHKKFEARS